jgi:RNA polymerase sigma-70 factor, ECF subfamily
VAANDIPHSDDDRSMARLSLGDADALRDVIARHGTALLNFLHQLVGERAAAEDLCQETFLRVYRHASRYVPGGGFRAWIYTIARHLALNHQRDRSLERDRRPEPPAAARPPDGGEGHELQRAINRAIEAVSEPFRSALVLCVLHGLSYEEAAQASGCSVKTLSSRLARGRERFRELMAPYLADGAAVGLEAR